MKHILLVLCLVLPGCAVIDAVQFCSSNPEHCMSDVSVTTVTINNNVYKVMK